MPPRADLPEYFTIEAGGFRSRVASLPLSSTPMKDAGPSASCRRRSDQHAETDLFVEHTFAPTLVRRRSFRSVGVDRALAERSARTGGWL